jgi:hypothetical protein
MGSSETARPVDVNVNAVEEPAVGLASVVSEGAEGTVAMISCQIDAQRAIEEARQSMAERYREMTESELAGELATRRLPESGNVEELRERLLDNDFERK